MNKVEIAFQRGYRVDESGLAHGIKVEVLSTAPTSMGYLRFSIHIGAKRKDITVHRLQAFQKFGQDMFQDGIVVRHLNGDKRDNSWDNIAIGTQSDNIMDMSAEARRTRAVPGGRYNSHLSTEDVQEIRRLCEEEGWMQKELAAKFGIARPTVSDIIHRKTWRDI